MPFDGESWRERSTEMLRWFRKTRLSQAKLCLREKGANSWRVPPTHIYSGLA